MTDTAERKMRFLYALRSKGVTDIRVLTAMERIEPVGSPAIPPGPALFDPRRNSRGFDLTDAADLALIEQARAPHRDRLFDARPRLAGPARGPRVGRRGAVGPAERSSAAADPALTGRPVAK
jgi:delta 1-pyrroline-5-carboxylate dehydrogenase